MKRNGFPRTIRVRKRADFLRIQGRGQKFRTQHFLVFIMASQSGTNSHFRPRIGITVTRKIGKAVVRNRIKRLLREAFRQQVQEFSGNLDMVWIAKNNAVSARYLDIKNDMNSILCRKLRTRNS